MFLKAKFSCSPFKSGMGKSKCCYECTYWPVKKHNKKQTRTPCAYPVFGNKVSFVLICYNNCLFIFFRNKVVFETVYSNLQVCFNSYSSHFY